MNTASYNTLTRALRPARVQAFSLVEILIVCALFVVLAVMVVPGTGDMLRSQDISAAGRIVEQSLNNARILAVTKNRRVEVRFYKSNSTSRIIGLQLFEFDESGTTPLPATAMRWLPKSATINENLANSTLWANLPVKSFSTLDPKIPLPEIGTDYEARAVQFLPNGGINLDPTQRWFLTVHETRSNPSSSSLPANFYCVQVEPVLGTTRVYRP